MAGVTLRAQNFKLDGRKLSKKLNKDLEALFVEAARAFLIAATRTIQVRTGFLLGAYSRLADVVGAFEGSAAKRTTKKGERIAEPRRVKNVSVVANRIARIRAEQTEIIKAIEKLQREEITSRRVFLNRVKAEASVNPNKEVFLRSLQAERRNEAITRQQTIAGLIKTAQRNRAGLTKALESFQKHLGKEFKGLRVDVDDTIRNLKLKSVLQQQRRTVGFQRALKNLRVARFVKKTMNDEAYQKSLRNLRAKFAQKSRGQRRIQEQIDQTVARLASPKLRGKLAKFKAKLDQRFAKQLRDAENEADDKFAARIAKKKQRLLLSKLSSLTTKEKEDNPLLRLVEQRRLKERRFRGNLEALRQRLAEKGETLNVVARTTEGRIVGQTRANVFNLRLGEKIKKVFNERDTRGKIANQRLEFYYPNPGTHGAGKILKTPQTGRRRATPSNLIITKVERGSSANQNLFSELAKTLQASGVSTSKVSSGLKTSLDKFNSEMSNVVQGYIFNFSIDITYLAVNDIKQAWHSWQSGIFAFNRVIATKGPQIIPNLSEFLLVEENVVNGTTISHTIRSG